MGVSYATFRDLLAAPAMSKLLLPAIIFAFMLSLAVLSNPSADVHRETIREQTADRNPLAGALGLGALAAFTSTYHSLAVASYTTLGERTVSVGAFGFVHVTEFGPHR